MLDILISPFARIIGIIALIGALFGAGYYKGYSSEKERFDAFKAELQAKAMAQELINEATKKQQDIIAKSIGSQYETKLSAIKSYYGRVYKRANSSELPSLPDPTIGIDGKTTDLPLACSYTTQQLISLQDWIKEVSKTN